MTSNTLEYVLHSCNGRNIRSRCIYFAFIQAPSKQQLTTGKSDTPKLQIHRMFSPLQFSWSQRLLRKQTFGCFIMFGEGPWNSGPVVTLMPSDRAADPCNRLANQMIERV